MNELNKKIYERHEMEHMRRVHPNLDHMPAGGLHIHSRPAFTQIDPEKAGDFVLLTVRDPLCVYSKDPAELIASHLENAECIGRSGMFTSYSGWYKGAHITAVSGGSGSPEMELALYDYMENTTAHTYLRVGGSGGIGTEVHPGDVVISSGVVRAEGMTKAYIPAEYPAVSHYEVVNAMSMAASMLGVNYHVGVTLSIDSDVIGCGRPAVGGYLQPWNLDVLGIYNRAGVLNGDRESAAIVTLSALFGRRGGSVCSVTDNVVTNERFVEGVAKNIEIMIALEGCAILNRMDKAKGEAKYWHPGIDISKEN